MSHTAQAVTTGVLLFDGEPRVTQGLRAWLRPFLLSDDVLDQSETQLGRPGLGLQFPAQTLHVELDTLEEGLLWEGARLGVDDGEQNYDELLRKICAAHGREDLARELLPAPANLQRPGCIEEASLRIEDVLRLALELADGHNATGAALLTGISSEGSGLWSAEGGSSLTVMRSDGSTRTASFSGMLLLQLALGEPAALGAWFAETVDVAVPPHKREEIYQAFFQVLEPAHRQPAPDNRSPRPRGR